MGKNPGKIVSFKKKDETIQKAIAYDSEQAPEFKKVKRVFLRYIDKNFKPQLGADGKKIVGLHYAADLTIIGFVD